MEQEERHRLKLEAMDRISLEQEELGMTRNQRNVFWSFVMDMSTEDMEWYWSIWSDERKDSAYRELTSN